ncbi:hypothetical protein YN1551_1491 [Sulfolobus islandicus Y.N.15.51]|uniref:Uncharacterized protein n=1 Tax=Saccharolobus islandicus (strain Y.N.15.51 / Yellowstone \|nr:hypothetical protein [Sulfolobus islandicus]ACP48580.1 hypothetical protein YN1551_1491 [Sulfolobus islandicus Y.N.15.51]
MRVRESIARTIAISVIYALLETYFVNLTNGGNIISPYHLLVLLVGLIAGFDRNLRIWIANALTYSVLEDAFYWVFKGQLPYAWSNEYIMIDHIPVYYIPYLTLALVLYKKSDKKDDKKNGGLNPTFR